MVLGSIASQFVKIGDSLSVTVQIAGKPTNLKYALSGAPDGMSISSDGLISWAVGSEHDGNSYNVRVLAIDQDALMAVGRSFTVKVNHNPKWEVIGAQSVKEQSLLAFAPVAIDLDDTDLSLVVSGLPTGSTYDSSSGFSWTPGHGQIGVHNVGFTVTDPHGSSSDLAVQITVNANVVPTLAAISSVSILAGESARAQTVASDADDDITALSYSLNNAPEGMQVSQSGAITWVTQSGVHSGEYTADVVVTDSFGESASQPIKVTVNGAPVVESIDPFVLKIGDKVEFTVAASDPEGGELSYKALSNPDGFEGSSENGINDNFNWTTDNAVDGEYKIDIEVLDTAGLKSVVTVQVSLKLNELPTMAVIESVTVKPEEALEIQVTADDPDGDNVKLKYLLRNAPEGMLVSGSGLIQWSVPKDAEDATYTVTVFAVDDRDGLTSETLEVTVNANKPPTVEPVEAITAKVGDDVGFTISATDPEGGKLKYKALKNPSGFKKKIRNGYNGVFLWYTAKASAGDYTIDIEVEDVGGLKTVVTVKITLEPVTSLTLLSAPSVLGPFKPEVGAVINEDAKTITVATAGDMHFYRLLSGDDTKLKITSIAVKDDKAVIGYKPAGE